MHEWLDKWMDGRMERESWRGREREKERRERMRREREIKSVKTGQQ